MKKAKIINISVVLLGMALLSGCNQKESKKISVYRVETDALYMSALDTYQKENPGLELEIKTFPNYAEMKDQLNTELMSGKGPDVLLYNSLQSEADPFKLAKSGTFLSLDNYMEALPSDEYFMEIMEAGVINGSQYILPLSWNILQTYSTQKLVNEQNYRGQTFYTVLPKEAERLVTENDCAVCSLQFGRADVLNYFAEISGLSVIDSSGSLLIDENSFRQLAEFTKVIYDNVNKIQGIVQRYRNDFVGAAAHLSFLLEDYSFMNNLRYYQSVYSKSLGEEMVMNPVTQLNSKGITAQVIQYGAVNANSKVPDEAWKLLLAVANTSVSTDFSKYDEAKVYYAPVKVSLYNDCVVQLSTQNGKGAKGPAEPLDEENTSLLQQISQDVAMAVVPNVSIGNLVQECMEPYLIGNGDYESCYQGLMNKLELYLDE